MKVHFTGNLESLLYTNPFFFEKEKYLLRAQISRIQHSTSLVPKGVYRLVEDTPREIEDNQPDEGPIPIPTTLEMANP